LSLLSDDEAEGVVVELRIARALQQHLQVLSEQYGTSLDSLIWAALQNLSMQAALEQADMALFYGPVDSVGRPQGVTPTFSPTYKAEPSQVADLAVRYRAMQQFPSVGQRASELDSN